MTPLELLIYTLFFGWMWFWAAVVCGNAHWRSESHKDWTMTKWMAIGYAGIGAILILCTVPYQPLFSTIVPPFLPGIVFTVPGFYFGRREGMIRFPPTSS